MQPAVTTDHQSTHPASPVQFDPPPASAGHRSWSQVLSALAGALRSERIKATSLRSNQALVLITFLGGAATSILVATFVKDEVLFLSDVAFYWTVVSAMIAAVCGITAFTAEVQHGSLAPMLVARPSRQSLGLTKLATVMTFGAVLGVAGVAGGLVGGVLAGLPTGGSGRIPMTVLWAVVDTMLSAALGLGIGMIVRHGSAAISGLLIWGLVVENLLTAFLPASAVRFLPFYAGTHLLAIESDLDTPAAIASALTRPQNALVLATYALLALILGLVVLHRFDVD